MTTFSLEVSVDGDEIVVYLVGDLDMASAPDAARLAHDALAPETHILVVDMSGVQFMDSMGLSALVAARSYCLDHDVDFRLRGLTHRVHRVLELTGLADWFGAPPTA